MRSSNGSFGLIIDALDEARLKITSQSFEAFLGDIAAFAKAPRSVILMGRSQIAETAWIALENKGVPTALARIEYFSKTSAYKYIETKLRARGGDAAASLNNHPGPFAQARDAIYDVLEKAASGNADQFLGYAPVLDAIAVRLSDSSNFAATVSEFSDSNPEGIVGRARAVGLLRKICDDILERERKHKLVKNLKPALSQLAAAHKWSEWDAVYTAKEQCNRLAAKVLGANLPAFGDMPGPLRTTYESQIATFVEEHPFLENASRWANVVFEAYVLARLLHGEPSAVRTAVEHRFVMAGPPTRLVADLYFLFMRETGADLVPPEHLSALYHSLATAESKELHVLMNIEGNDPEDADASNQDFAEVELSLCDHNADLDKSFEEVYGFKTLSGATVVLPLSHRIADTYISFDGVVRLAGSSGEFEIGPSVDIRCRKLIIEAQSLVINSMSARPTRDVDADESAVVLKALECECSLVRNIEEHGELHVDWPNASAFPFTNFSGADEALQQFRNDAMLLEVFKRFRRIVLTLRSHSKGSLARYYKKVEHQRILKGDVGRRLLDQLISDRILLRKGNFYHWQPEAGSQHVGIAWHDLQKGQSSAKLRDYLGAFLESLSA